MPNRVQKDQALLLALREKAQLQQDLQLMLAARESLAALRDSLQQGDFKAPMAAVVG